LGYYTKKRNKRERSVILGAFCFPGIGELVTGRLLFSASLIELCSMWVGSQSYYARFGINWKQVFSG
jgi:hypothetical protein